MPRPINLATPRVPAAPLSARMYESHYLTATDPAGGRALWLRHTSLKRAGQPAHPTVWLTWFDRAAPAPSAMRVTAADPVVDPGEAWARSSLGTFGPGAARGAIERASWQLSWVDDARDPVPYLPARWLYDRAVPRSNGVALVPAATVNGTLKLGDQVLALDGWHGIVGHNWGSEHADHWSWLHAGGFGDDGSGWMDLALARVKLGPVLTPWLGGGAIRLDGQTLTPARGGRFSRTIEGERTAVSVPLAGGTKLELAITAPDASTIAWDYASASSAGREVRNCSVADAVLTLRGPGGNRAFDIPGRFAVEHGSSAS